MGGFSFETDTALAIALSGSLSDQLTITPAFGNARTEPAGQTIWLQPGDQVLVSRFEAAIWRSFLCRPTLIFRLFLALSARRQMPASADLTAACCAPETGCRCGL